jgi:hypothetical protein
MTKADIELLKTIWVQLAEEEFSKDKLIERVLHDGGHDMSNLSQADVAALLEGRFKGDWHNPAFSFSELLAYYRACGEELTSQQIVGWVFAAFVIADAIEHDAAEWLSLLGNTSKLITPSKYYGACFVRIQRWFNDKGRKDLAVSQGRCEVSRPAENAPQANLLFPFRVHAL